MEIKAVSDHERLNSKSIVFCLFPTDNCKVTEVLCIFTLNFNVM